MHVCSVEIHGIWLAHWHKGCGGEVEQAASKAVEGTQEGSCEEGCVAGTSDKREAG